MAANMDLSKIFSVQNLDNRDYIIIGLIILLSFLLFFRKKREHFTMNPDECGVITPDGKSYLATDSRCKDSLKPRCDYTTSFADPNKAFRCVKYNCGDDVDCKTPEKGGRSTTRPYCVKANGVATGFCGNVNDLYPSSFPPSNAPSSVNY
jgi:LPXTG-motif cell wall-anchored protein